MVSASHAPGTVAGTGHALASRTDRELRVPVRRRMLLSHPDKQNLPLPWAPLAVRSCFLVSVYHCAKFRCPVEFPFWRDLLVLAGHSPGSAIIGGGDIPRIMSPG